MHILLKNFELPNDEHMFISCSLVAIQEYKSEVSFTLDEVTRLVQQSSEMGDERPISGCQFSPDGQQLAICGETGFASQSIYISPPIEGHILVITIQSTSTYFTP